MGHRDLLGDTEIDASGCGGLLAQADSCGGRVGIFGVDAVEGLSILRLIK